MSQRGQNQQRKRHDRQLDRNREKKGKQKLRAVGSGGHGSAGHKFSFGHFFRLWFFYLLIFGAIGLMVALIGDLMVDPWWLLADAVLVVVISIICTIVHVAKRQWTTLDDRAERF
jgi:hypothetical protein